jgi:hypothetical protein
MLRMGRQNQSKGRSMLGGGVENQRGPAAVM